MLCFKRRPEIRALPLHDSCSWALDPFGETWGSGFDVVTFGQPIEFYGNGHQEDV
jgi:hypothetical protein